MRMLPALVARSFRRHRGLLAGLTVVLGGFQVLLVVIARNLQREGLFSQLAALVPPFIQEALGGAVLASFGGLAAFGFFHPVVMLALSIGAVFLASEPAGEIEDGLVDLVAARPVARALLVARTVIVFATATAAIVIVMLAANRLALLWLAPPGVPLPALAGMLWVALNLAAVAWCFGAGGLVAASYASRRATAAGAISLTAVCLYLLQFAAASWAPARPLARISPFHYYEGIRILLGQRDPRPDIVVLVVAAAVLIAWAGVVYARRDL